MRYVGKYRVMSEIDKTTNDFPKEWHTRQNGEIEKTNCDNDIYIVCKNNCKILNYGKIQIKQDLAKYIDYRWGNCSSFRN